MRFREIEKVILNDGWYWVKTRGSHYQYKHPIKGGKVTIQKHPGGYTQSNDKEYLKTSRASIRRKPL